MELLNSEHHCEDFSCGVPLLDLYLQKQAIIDARRQLSIVYVLNGNDKTVAGYYTLSSTMIELANDQTISGAVISRLAVDKQHQKKGYGELLLLDALYQAHSLNQENALFTIIVNSINKKAAQFYKKYGFTQFAHQENRLYLPMDVNI